MPRHGKRQREDEKGTGHLCIGALHIVKECHTGDRIVSIVNQTFECLRKHPVSGGLLIKAEAEFSRGGGPHKRP